jgi:hypothetical protein
MLYKRSPITLKLIKMKTKRLLYSLLVAQICAVSSQTKAEHWGYDYELLDDDVCDEGKDECDIIMAGGHLRAFASSCHNQAYDPLAEIRDTNGFTKNYVSQVFSGVLHQECVLGEEITIGQFGPMITNGYGSTLWKLTHQHFVGAWTADTVIWKDGETSNREFIQVDFPYQLEVK